MWNAGWSEAQVRFKIARRNVNNLRYADAMTLMAETEQELKSVLMKVKEESEKAGSTTNTILSSNYPPIKNKLKKLNI